MRRKFLVTLLSALLAACGGGGTSTKTCTVELIGDSILNGYNLQVTPAEYIKNAFSSVNIIQNTANGESLNSFIKNYKYDTNADVVIFQLGLNDSLSKEAFDNFENNLDVFLSKNISQGKKVVLTSIVKIDAGQSDFWTPEVKERAIILNSIVLHYTRKYNLDNARWDLVPYAYDDTIDGVHRIQDASNRLTSLLFPYISKQCKF